MVLKKKNVLLGIAVGILLGITLVIYCHQESKPIGYTLQFRESAILSWVMKDEASSFQRGEDSLLSKRMLTASALEVSTAYQNNQVAADKKYFEKQLRLTGVIESIASGIGNEPYIVLRGGNMFLSPQVRFNEPDVERIAALKKGQELVLVCDGEGSIAEAPMFKNCVFADDYINQQLSKMQDAIAAFLAGRPQEESDENITVGMMAIWAIGVARVLPKTSTCFSDGKSCSKEMMEFLPSNSKLMSTTMRNLVQELREHGVQLSDHALKKLASKS